MLLHPLLHGLLLLNSKLHSGFQVKQVAFPCHIPIFWESNYRVFEEILFIVFTPVYFIDPLKGKRIIDNLICRYFLCRFYIGLVEAKCLSHNDFSTLLLLHWSFGKVELRGPSLHPTASNETGLVYY